jgi:hypothetical protein
MDMNVQIVYIWFIVVAISGSVISHHEELAKYVDSCGAEI